MLQQLLELGQLAPVFGAQSVVFELATAAEGSLKSSHTTITQIAIFNTSDYLVHAVGVSTNKHGLANKVDYMASAPYLCSNWLDTEVVLTAEKLNCGVSVDAYCT